MSTFVKREAPQGKGSKLVWVLGIVWLAVLAAIWVLYRNSDGQGGGILHFIGRFHVMIVHLPIGVIFLAFGMDVLTRFTAFSHLRSSLPFVLWIAFLSAIGATVVGYLLMSVEGFEGRAMDLHMYFGLAVVVASLLALIFQLKGKMGVSTLAMAAAVFTTVASGHFGGAMIHDTEYLTEHAPEAIKPLLLVGIEKAGDAVEVAEETEESEEETATPLAERVVYTDFIVPILDAKCNECHNENKVKGKLRMDTHELLLAGAEGSDFPTVLPGDADESEMIIRVTLPEDDDEFMPPKGEGLAPEEIKMLSLWIAAGADQETTIADLGEDPTIEATALAVEAIHAAEGDAEAFVSAGFQSMWDILPPEERQQRMDDVLAASEKYHFSIMPISAEDDRLRVNVINAAKEFGDEQLALLEPVADRIIWLDLARSQITDEGMKIVGKMGALERLHLENTSVTDAGIAHLGSMQYLEYLNLYGTKVGNGVFESFRKMPNLRKVYVWQTDIASDEARAYERSVNLEINTGVDLVVVEESAEEPAAAAEKPAPKPEAKPAAKEEKKPAATPVAKPAPKAEAKPEAKPAPKPAPKATPPATKPSEPAKKPEAKPASTPAPKPAPKATPPATKPAEPVKKPEAKPAVPPKPTEAKPKADAPPAPKPAPKAQ